MNKTVQINVKLISSLEKDSKKYIKDFGYKNIQELICEALREKLYGKNIKEQITNEFLKEIEKEKEYVFSEKKDLHEKLKNIASRF